MWPAPGSPEHSVGRLGVRVEVELCTGGDIADGLHVAAHDDQAGQSLPEPRVCQQPDGEVSQGAQRHQGHQAGVGPGQPGEHAAAAGVRRAVTEISWHEGHRP